MLEFPIEFYDDEVRDGFYVSSMMKHNWAAQMEIVNVVDEICRRNNIKYYLFAGTLIGAVRHKGFIPWDDDMDICMLRKDYKRFLKALDREKPESYLVRNYYKEKDYREVFTRLLDDDGILIAPEFWSKRHGFVCNAGIDIFPLDYIPKDKEVRETISHRIMHLHYIIKKYDDEGFTEDLEKKLVAIEKELKVSINRDDSIPQQMYFIMDDLLESVKKSESKNVHIFLRWAQGQCGEGIPIDALDNTVDIKFETALFMAPYRYDKVLKAMFGKYMDSLRVCEIHNYPWYQRLFEDVRRVQGFIAYPFLRELLPEKNRREKWENKLKEELNEYVNLFAKASELAEKSFASGDTQTGNMLLEKCRTLADNAEAIDKKLNGNGRDRVVFLTWKAGYWKSIEPYYNREVEAGNEVLVVPVPYTRLTESRTRTKEYIETEGFPDYVQLSDFSQINYEEVRISRIYTQNPYDTENGAISLRDFFYTTNIRQYTDELIYVPWFELDEYDSNDERAMYMMQFFVRVPGIVAVDKILLPKSQEWIKKHYINNLVEWAGEETRDIWEEKIIVSDYVMNEDAVDIDRSTKAEGSNTKKVILYYVGRGQILADPEKEIEKIKKNLEIFEKSKDKITVRLFVEYGLVDSVKKYDEKYVGALLEVIDAYKSSVYCEVIMSEKPIDINDGYVHDLVAATDAFYGDSGILMHLFDRTNKPVMQQNINI